jgi:hypothetical protein
MWDKFIIYQQLPGYQGQAFFAGKWDSHHSPSLVIAAI